MVIQDMGNHEGEHWLAFFCPGCEGAHSIPVTGPRAWGWNESFDKPTFTPSIMVNRGKKNPTEPVCHSNVTDGMICFHGDSDHKLSGQTVAIPKW